jgi:hypothetical protein
MPNRPQYGQKEFQFTKMFTCGSCGSGITAEEKIKRNKGNGNVHRFVYYRCTQAKDRSCQEPPMREKDVLDQLLAIIDTVDIDQIGARKRIEDELERYNAFAENVLEKKIVKPKQKEVSIRKFAKHILAHGTREEKREILEHLQNAITIKDRVLKIHQITQKR